MLTHLLPPDKGYESVNDSPEAITYTDYDGNDRTEEFLFNLNESELIAMNLGTAGGLDKVMKKMVENQDVTPLVYNNLTAENIHAVEEYIKAPMTATWFSEEKGANKRSREIITAEVIYYWMIAQQIPFSCEKWHLNRLITLIQVCSKKNAPKKKMGQKDLYARNRSLNAARRKQHHTKG